MTIEGTIKHERRPCIVTSRNHEPRRALWHYWCQEADVVGASPLVGGHAAGQVSGVMALVEYETGDVDKVPPHRVRFLDSKEEFEEIAWPESTCRYSLHGQCTAQPERPPCTQYAGYCPMAPERKRRP